MMVDKTDTLKGRLMQTDGDVDAVCSLCKEYFLFLIDIPLKGW